MDSGRIELGGGRSSPPVLLDLFCGVGGAAMGYHRAGFTVVGVDIEPQKHYPFAFIQADAIKLLPYIDKRKVSAVHASPPCLKWTDATGTRQSETDAPDLITPTRNLLVQTGLPYVIENVRNAPLKHPTFVCGTERGLIIKGDGQLYRLRRHRYFETNWAFKSRGCTCRQNKHIPVMDVTGGGGLRDRPGRTFRGSAEMRRQILGVPWAARHELADAIPPAYTELIGRQLRNVVENRRHQ